MISKITNRNARCTMEKTRWHHDIQWSWKVLLVRRRDGHEDVFKMKKKHCNKLNKRIGSETFSLEGHKF